MAACAMPQPAMLQSAAACSIPLQSRRRCGVAMRQRRHSHIAASAPEVPSPGLTKRLLGSAAPIENKVEVSLILHASMNRDTACAGAGAGVESDYTCSAFLFSNLSWSNVLFAPRAARSASDLAMPCAFLIV